MTNFIAVPYQMPAVITWRQGIIFTRTIGVCANEQTSAMIESCTWRGFNKEAAAQVVRPLARWNYPTHYPEIVVWSEDLLQVAYDAESDLYGKVAGEAVGYIDHPQYHLYPHPKTIAEPELMELFDIDIPCMIVGLIVIPVRGDKPEEIGIIFGFHLQPGAGNMEDTLKLRGGGAWNPYLPRIRFLPMITAESTLSKSHAMGITMIEFLNQDFIQKDKLRETITKGERRDIERRRESIPEVTHVYLKRLTREQERELKRSEEESMEAGGDGAGRSLTCQYWRKGTWVRQPYGPPELKLRKRIRRHGRVCGPKDKPYRQRIVHLPHE